MATEDESKMDPNREVRRHGVRPSREQRQAAKLRIMEVVNSSLGYRIDEVFEMADWGDIPWSALNRIGDQICGGVASELEGDIGEYVFEILEDTMGSTPIAVGKEVDPVQQKEPSAEGESSNPPTKS